MAILSWLCGSLGGLSLVMGLIVIMDLIPDYSDISYLGLITWQFWMACSIVLMLAAVAFALGYGNSGERD